MKPVRMTNAVSEFRKRRSGARAALLGGLALLAASASPAAVPPPNVVVMLADDLGYGDVHALNPQRGKIATPNLDRLAAQGMAFTDAHGGSSVCTPTRYGLLTGRYAWRTRLQRGVLDDYVTPLIADSRLTLPALLKQHGYRTAAVGKWHLGFTVEGGEGEGTSRKGKGTGKGKGGGKLAGAPMGARTKDGPLTRGFDHFYGFHHARMMKSVFTDDRVTEFVEPVDMLPKLVAHASGWIADRAREGAPFFLYFALNSPHTPIVPSKAWQGRSGLGDYGDFVMETDGAVGDVLAALDRAGVATNTLVIFASDNGCSPAAGIGKLEGQGHFPSAQFRGYKADIWDGGHRIPFIARWPGAVAPGTTCARLVCLTDLMATCAELTGATLPAGSGEDSVSLLPLLRGADRPVRESVVHHSIQGCFAVREGSWKLEFCPGSGGWGSPRDGEAAKRGLPAVQLYDLAADPGETNNVAAARADVVARMTARLERIVGSGRSTPGPAQTNDVAVQWRVKDTTETGATE